MMKKLLFVVLILFLIGEIISFAQNTSLVNPNTLVYEEPGVPVTLDPAIAYDTVSDGILMNIYDNLVQYDGTSTVNLSPMLSTNVPSVADGTILDNGTTYVFHIRQGVYFHNGDLLTPQDVVYSLERTITLDEAGGPSWMLAGPFFPMIDGQYVSTIVQVVANELGLSNPLNYTSLDSLGIFATGTKNPLNDKYKQALIGAFNLLAKDFEIKGNDVIIHLPQPYSPFLYILSIPNVWTSILDQKWCADHDAWNGSSDNWWYYHNPVVGSDPLYNIENGTGPYVMQYYTPGREVFLQRFDSYWAGPAKTKYAVIKFVNEFTTRLLDLKSGEADFVYVPVQNLIQVENNPDIQVITGLPSLQVTAIALRWNVSTQGNPYIGSGKLDGNGIPPDFFSNLDVRKAFEYTFPYQQFIKEALGGMAIQPNSAIINGLLGYDPDLPKYEQDLAKATEYFKKAYDGKLWQEGFTFSAVCAIPDETQNVLEALSTSLMKINPKFRMNVVALLLPNYNAANLAAQPPMFVTKWTADYPDPYDFAWGYYTTDIYASNFGQDFNDFVQKNLTPLVSSLITNTVPSQRAEIAKQLAQVDHDNALYIWIDQPTGYWVERTWVKGWYYNAMISGEGPYFYSLSK